MSKLTEHRTITLELSAVKGFDFEALLGAIEEVLNRYSGFGMDQLDWDIRREG